MYAEIVEADGLLVRVEGGMTFGAVGGTMLNLLIRSKTFCTCRDSGLSAGSISVSAFSKPLAKEMCSKFSILF